VSAAIRLTVVLTHPVQYFAPWFRFIAASCPEIDLTVLYGAIPTASQQGSGFERKFAWDIPLTEGYRFAVCEGAKATSFDSDRLFGVDVPGIGRQIRDTSPDVVLVTGWHSAMQLRAIRACRRLGIPVLYRGDSTRFSGRALLRPLWALKTRVMLRQFDGYLAVGHAADEYLRTFGAPDPLIVRSPHCVDNDRFQIAADSSRSTGRRARDRATLGIKDNDFAVLFAGKFQPVKRPLDAVRAVAALGPSAVLMMAGDGPLADAAREEARRLDVRLAWRGFVNQSQLPAVFAASDAMIVPSGRETWGLVVNEALASGVPCVVTRAVGCAQDLIEDGVTGFAVDTGDVPALAASLDRIRNAQRGGHDYAPDCQRRVAAFSFDAAAAGLRALSRRVVQRRIGPAARQAAVRVVACCGGMVSIFGAERMSFEVFRVLRRYGAAVHCMLNSWGSSRVALLAEEIDATWSPGHTAAPMRRRGATPSSMMRLACDILLTSAALYRDAATIRATHVFAPDFAAVLRNLPAIALLRLRGVRVVLKAGNAPDVTPFYQRLWRFAVTPFVHAFVANSRFTAAALGEIGVDARKIHLIHNCAPARRPMLSSEPRDERRIIYVGQLIPPKGPHLLLEAVATLAARGVSATLDVVGDIDGWESPVWAGYHGRLRARAAEPDLAGRVRFLGQRDDVPALLEASAVHCAPSLPEIREAFGVVVVEAKEAGIPSVVTPSGGLPELIEHRQDGWICSTATAEEIAAGLEYFLVDRTRRESAGAAARRSAQRVSHAAFAQAWLDVFGLPAPDATAPAIAVERHAH